MIGSTNTLYTPYVIASQVQEVKAADLYSYGERILRLMALNGVVSDLFERVLLWIYEACSQRSLKPKLFSAEREAAGTQSLMRLGGSPIILYPADGCARLEAMHLMAYVLEKKINALGGRWERIKPDENQPSMFAIIPPTQLTPEWNQLQADMLRLKWPVKEVMLNGVSSKVLVTCPDADAIPSENGRELFVHHSSSSPTFSMLTWRIGTVLGWKRDIFLYNTRGMGNSSGIPSEAGFYNDALAVWDWVKKSVYDFKKTWFTSACAGGYRAGFLFAELDEVSKGGVNWVWENGTVVAERDWIGVQQPSLARWLGKRWMSGFACRDIPKEARPRETQFNLDALYPPDAPKAKGRCIVIGPDKDSLFARDKVEAFAKAHFSNVQSFTFSSNIHDARYFHHFDATRQVQQAIFSPSMI